MRRLHWLLWLLIALMPVRGVAQSLMAFAPATGVAGATAPAADAAPCPMHATDATAEVDRAALQSTPAGDGITSVAHASSLCSVCHSAMLPLTLALAQAPAIPDGAPLPSHGLGAGRAAPAELFRPPR